MPSFGAPAADWVVPFVDLRDAVQKGHDEKQELILNELIDMAKSRPGALVMLCSAAIGAVPLFVAHVCGQRSCARRPWRTKAAYLPCPDAYEAN